MDFLSESRKRGQEGPNLPSITAVIQPFIIYKNLMNMLISLVSIKVKIPFYKNTMLEFLSAW
jgi:hypothetical protein